MTSVVIIEDNEVMRMTIRSLLRHAGYQVLAEGRDGRAGMELVRQWTPDVVCLDIMLPDISGVEVLCELRKEFRELPVVIVSAYADRATLQKLMNCAADAVVVKPFTEGRLVDAIESALRTRGACSQCQPSGAPE